MGIVVLDRQNREPQFAGHCHGVVARVQVTGNDGRLCLEQRRESAYRLFQGLDRAQVAHISDIRRGIE